jgi:uncharacterized protein (TIGR00269 family)
LQSGPVLDGKNIKFVPKVKPFTLIPEKEIALYAYLKEIPFQKEPCPYASTALRNDVRYMLNMLEERHPGTLPNIYRSAEKLRDNLQRIVTKQYTQCRECGFPSSSNKCSVCKILELRQ